MCTELKLHVYTVCGEGCSLPVRLQRVERQTEEAGHPRKAPPTRLQHPRTFRKWISTLGKTGQIWGYLWHRKHARKSQRLCHPEGHLQEDHMVIALHRNIPQMDARDLGGLAAWFL